MSVHIPPGFPFAKPPDKDDELFMGSSTVLADGEPFSHVALPVLSCQVAGMMSPMRLKKKGGPHLGMLPLTFNLAIVRTFIASSARTSAAVSMASSHAAATGFIATLNSPIWGLLASPSNPRKVYVLARLMPFNWEK
jgi:hypothetical protein